MSEMQIEPLSTQPPTVINFVNRADQDVVLYWVNYDQQEIQYGIIKQGEQHLQKTYVGHQWAVRTLSGSEANKLLIRIYALNEPMNYIVPASMASEEVAGVETTTTCTFQIRNYLD